MKKNCRKQIKQNLELKKVITRKGDKLYLKWKGYDNSFNGSIDKKKTQYNHHKKMSEHFPKLNEPFSGDVSVKLDLFNYVAKDDFEGAAGIDQSNLAANSDLAKLNAEADKVDVGKLRTVSVDLSKLSNVVNNDVVKKIVCNKLVTKVYSIDIGRFALKLSMTRINQVQKTKSVTLTRKYLMLVGLLKKRIITPK